MRPLAPDITPYIAHQTTPAGALTHGSTATTRAGSLRSLTTLLALGGLSLLTAVTGAAVNAKLKNRIWYRLLRKSKLTPPDGVFGVVWPALYTLSAISGWRVARAATSRSRNAALGLWGAQLGLNAAWTPIFFGAHRPRLALADLAANTATLAGYTYCATRVDRSAARLMFPYLGWLGFAAILNSEAIRKNRGVTRVLVRD